MDPITIIDLTLRYGPSVVSLVTQALSNDDLTTKLKNLSAPLADMLEVIGSNLFPKAAPTLHIVGGALRAFDLDGTKWLQGALNVLLAAEVPAPVPLVVDGIYGPKTRAAVEQAQVKFGLTVDGIAGTITQAAIMAALAK